MRILILGAASSPAADAEGLPVWLTELHGEVLIERFVAACSGLQPNRLIFAVLAHDIRKYRIDSVIRLTSPDAVIVKIDHEAKGAVCTALLAMRHIGADDELLIMNSNEFISIDYREAVDQFRKRGLDAGVVVFPSVHPRYSYIRLDEDGLVVEAAEKNPISRYATAGFYWFRCGGDFISASFETIRKDASVDGLFYICPVFNELVLRQKKIGVMEIDRKFYHPLKSIRQIAAYEADQSAEHIV